MSKRKNINRSTVLAGTPTGSPISENFRLEESAVPVRSTSLRYPLVISTPRTTPVVMGLCEFWSKALIETMFAAAKRRASVCPAAGYPRTADGTPVVQG